MFTDMPGETDMTNSCKGLVYALTLLMVKYIYIYIYIQLQLELKKPK